MALFWWAVYAPRPDKGDWIRLAIVPTETEARNSPAAIRLKEKARIASGFSDSLGHTMTHKQLAALEKQSDVPAYLTTRN